MNFGRMWKAIRLLYRIEKKLEEARRMDKPAYKSKTNWGQAIKVIGWVITMIGLVLTGEKGVEELFSSFTNPEVYGPIMALIGSFIHVLGKRDLEGRKVAALERQTSRS